MCDGQLQSCLANCGLGGGGSGGGGGGSLIDILTDEQLAAVQKCQDTLSVANADGDGLITHDEYLAHVELYASASCPGVPRPLDYADEFESISCLLCAGLVDPNDPFAHDGHCPCVDGAPAGPIDLGVSTEFEVFFYCGQIEEPAAISCVQPDRACHDSCYADEAKCQEGCLGAIEDVTQILECIDECNRPFYQCLIGCVGTAGVTAGEIPDGDGGGHPGEDSQPENTAAAGGSTDAAPIAIFQDSAQQQSGSATQLTASANDAGGAEMGDAAPGGLFQGGAQSQPGGAPGTSNTEAEGGDSAPPGGLVPGGEQRPGGGCAYYTAASCRRAAEGLGLRAGGDFDFEGDYPTRGCFYYPPDAVTPFAGQAYFGTGGGQDEMAATPLPALAAPAERLDCGVTAVGVEDVTAAARLGAIFWSRRFLLAVIAATVLVVC